MGLLFGEKCSRCGRRSRDINQDTPTCEACLKQIETRLAAAAEQTRPCPMDETTMAKEVVGGSIVIDRCPTCKGVWLDRGELEQIRHSAELGVAAELMRGISTFPI